MWQRDIQFLGLDASLWSVLSLLTIVAAGVAIVVLYRFERRLVSAKAGYGLLALRLGTLLVLLLAFSEPVVNWSLNRRQSGTIAVAMDRSMSMTTIDEHANPGEKLRWARAMGMIGNEQTDTRIDRWIAAYEDLEEPRWVSPDENIPADQQAEVSLARQQQVEAVLKRVDQYSRAEIARQLMQGGEQPLVKSLDALGDLESFLFAETLAPVVELDQELGDEELQTLNPEISDLSVPLSGIASVDATKVGGVILITDGSHTDGENPITAARLLGNQGIPVFPIIMGTEKKPTDLNIVSLDHPLSIYDGDRPLITAVIGTAGFEGRPVEVNLLDEEGNKLESQLLTPFTTTTTIDFELDPPEIGRQRYTVRVEPQQEENRTDNNERGFSISVIDDTARVLLVDSEGRWEFRYLHQALERDERVAVTPVLFRQPYMGLLATPFFRRQLPPGGAANPFEEFDVVIIGDVASHQVTETNWEQLRDFVTEAGGTLVLIAGRTYFPLTHRSGSLDQLIPVEMPLEQRSGGSQALLPPAERGFKLELTPEGSDFDFLKFDVDGSRNRVLWSRLPGHTWLMQATPKPGSTVFVRQQPQAIARIGPNDEEERSGVLVHRYDGFGQVLWLGIDSTWRWRHRVGDAFHHRFWGQLARWAAEYKSLAGNEMVKFGLEKPEITTGEDALIRARWAPQALKQFAKIEAKVEIYDIDSDTPNDPVATLELDPLETRPLVHEGLATGLPEGNYKVRLVPSEDVLDGQLIEADLFVTKPQTDEFRDISANLTLLQEIAEASGGRVFRPDEASQLPAYFGDLTTVEQSTRDIRLWNHWVVMILFFGLLGVEWCVRKLNGLP